jgi:hypothetical protein
LLFLLPIASAAEFIGKISTDPSDQDYTNYVTTSTSNTVDTGGSSGGGSGGGSGGTSSHTVKTPSAPIVQGSAIISERKPTTNTVKVPKTVEVVPEVTEESIEQNTESEKTIPEVDRAGSAITGMAVGGSGNGGTYIGFAIVLAMVGTGLVIYFVKRRR